MSETVQQLAIKTMIVALHQAQGRGAFTLAEAGALSRAVAVFLDDKSAPSSSILQAAQGLLEKLAQTDEEVKADV